MSGIMMLLLGGAQKAKDNLFNYVSLLLSGNGTNGAQNNTFVDSSTNAFTITRNGNTTQGTFSPFSQTGWSNYFISGGIIRAGSSANLTLGSGAFTCECWVFPTAFTTLYAALWDFRNSGGFQAAAPLIWIGTDGKVNYQNASITSSSSLALNQWTHVAVVRNGTTVTMYFNGTSVGSVTDSTNMTNTYCAIGAVHDVRTTYYFSGYISNSRVVIGSAVYTSSFTPSTEPLTAISGTAFLTCQSNRFIDNSSNAFAITRNGDVSVQAFSPFNPTAAWDAATNGGSGYFDGTGDYLNLSGGTALTFGTGDFTIEFWYYSSNTGALQVFYDNRPSATNGAYITFYKSVSNVLELYVNASVRATGTTSIASGTWYHVALCRSGTDTKMFLNGSQEGSTYSDSTNYLNPANRPFIGADSGNVGVTPVNGYLSGFRVLKGTALYTAAFTPPTAPPTAVSNTELLLNFTNAGIYDATAKNDLETVGNAQISTTQSKFGGSSMYFDGTGDWLSSPDGQNYNLGSADFTIEMWVYANNLTSTYALFGKRTDTGTQYRWLVASINTNGTINVQLTTNGSSWAINANTTGTMSATSWTHLAFVRYGSDFSVYINGVKNTLSSSLSGSVYNGTEALIIGAGGTTGAYVFALNGYIQDVRITKGVARYTTGFTPPTAAFPLT